jgi:predicted Rossmann fold flavoprotein
VVRCTAQGRLPKVSAGDAVITEIPRGAASGGVSRLQHMSTRHIAIVGGGAAGFFAAIRAAEAAASRRGAGGGAPDTGIDVTIYEATAHPLAKVRVSGGGRCNVTNACLDPRELVANYPRGGRELLGPLHRFGPRETVEWFAERGVPLKTEPDGRMFPTTDDSATIIDCLQRAATAASVRVRLRCGVSGIVRAVGGGFELALTGGETARADRVLLATGGTKGTAGASIAQTLGHTVEPQVPSLFTFHLDDARLRGLEGLAVPDAEVTLRGSRLRARGPVLVTHWGLSGPAILRLSAWGARELHADGYRATIEINWAAPRPRSGAAEELAAARATHARKHLGSVNPFGLPVRLWERLVVAAGLRVDAPWAGLSAAGAQALVAQVAACEFVVAGKSLNKDEFVTCGGVRLREVNFRTMESRVCRGLFFAGELLDIDGITGGFNFQAAWTTGWIAGTAIAEA